MPFVDHSGLNALEVIRGVLHIETVRLLVVRDFLHIVDYFQYLTWHSTPSHSTRAKAALTPATDLSFAKRISVFLSLISAGCMLN